MNTIPILGFAAFSHTGKTTLIEKLVRSLKADGYRIAVIKHDGHDFDIDQEGKDSYRFAQAGADVTLISSASKTALIDYREHTLAENIQMIHDVDLILIEGYKNEAIPQIGIYRKASGKPLPHPEEHYLAVVTDDEEFQSTVPVFQLDDVDAVAAFIKKEFHKN